MSVYGINVNMSENPNHYMMIYGALSIVLSLVASFYNMPGTYIAIPGILGVIFLVIGYLKLESNYKTHNNLNLNLKRKELGLKLKIPDNEELKEIEAKLKK